MEHKFWKEKALFAVKKMFRAIFSRIIENDKGQGTI